MLWDALVVVPASVEKEINAFARIARGVVADKARQKAVRASSDTSRVRNTDELALHVQSLDAQGLKRSEIAEAIERSESRVYQLLRRAKKLQSGARHQVPR